MADPEEEAGPHRKKDANRQKVLIGIGIASLLVILLMLRKSNSNSSTDPNATAAADLAAQQGAYGYPVGYGYGGSAASTGTLASDPYAQQMMAELIGIQASIANESATGNGISTSPVTVPGTAATTPVSSPSSTPSASYVAPVAPAQSADPLAGWTYLPTYADFLSAKSNRETIDYTDAGSTTLLPFMAGGKQVGSAPPSGSRWYAQ